ncbi:hypothetical protein L596_010887 [Steinernema carpocapsae]|uniref:Poly [ADP-ribose] polymerase n=1 Tax=Steinernema carpocapsae TaxID=34508 RepID=A0A4U5PKC2_STECR|nr:hypothetical protein L596_010887 [Steinernema carpocapsae]
MSDSHALSEKGLIFTSIHEYRCMGHISEYTRCSYTTKQPDRVPFKLPKEIRENHPQLEKYHKKRPSDRIYPAYLSNQEVVNTPSTSYTPARNYKSGHREEGPVYVKHGYAVDPECDDYEQFHVYIDRDDGNKAWQASLGAADVQLNRNSYYKLQLVQHDKRSKFMLFRSWGRIGTTIGGCKTESFGSDLDAAKEAFEFQFHEKSGNEWSHVENFKKKAGFMDLLEMEMLQDKKTDLKLNLEESKSKLHRSIQELMAMIFDVDAMKDVMKEMEVDTEKLPLGKLSKKHVLNAYSVLTELQNLFKNNEGYVDRDMILDATNRFYTLIPHDTGMAPVAVLDNHEIIKDKTELLDNLLEIQLAYTIVKREVDDDEGMDPIDESYAKLNVQMEVLDKESDEFQQLLTYMTNTHASTHDAYSLEVVDVYKVERQGEKERFKGDLHNRRLLWHGSRLTNYAGILSEGLRIAPPEAPVTGYMFGKGIYFADMVSKSANYCHALEKEGLLLLCDVALGDMQEEVHAKNITKLRKGKHSCKGLGLTYPNPKQVTYNEEGVMIPYGKPVSPATKDPLDLLYNEYIVYDESQVTIKYLVRAKFNPTITLL